jgi:hypothetical protein
VPIVITSSPGTKPGSFAVLKKRVARIVGGQNDPTKLAEAGEYINAAIRIFNTKLYECNKVKSSTITCTGGVGTLPTAFYKEIECRLTDSTGAKVRQLDYRDWVDFNDTFDGASSGLPAPTYYTLFNVHTLGQVELLPNPSTTAYVQLAYYRRFSELVADSESLDAPQEIEEALVLAAQVEMLYTNNPTSQVLQLVQAKAIAAWDGFAVIDRKHENSHPRMRLPRLVSLNIMQD